MTTTRALGFWTALALVIGNLIGSGVYLLPASLAPLGANALIGWLVTIAGAICLAFVFARLSAKLPRAGGPFAYAEAAFGPVAGYVVAWSYWVMLWSGNAAIAVAAVSALGLVFPALLTTPYLAAATALAVCWGLILVNVRGVALAGRVQLATTILKLIPLAGVILLGGWLMLRGGAVQPLAPAPVSAGGIATVAALTFWSFLGLESATVPADKIGDSARIVPRVTMLGVALTGGVYFLVTLAIAFLMPWQLTAGSPAPLAEFLGQSLGPGVAWLAALLAAVSAFGALNGFQLLTGEMPWAMAKAGVFPRWFAQESRAGTPARAHIVSGLLLTAVLLLNYTGKTVQLFQDIALISLAAGMVAYAASALAAFRLLPGDKALAAASLVSLAFVGWMTWGLGLQACLWGLALIALGLPVYFWARRE